MLKNKRSAKNRTTKYVVAALLVAVLLIGGGLFWNSRRSNSATGDTSTPAKKNTKATNTPAAEEKNKEEISNKDKAASNPETPKTNDSGKQMVTPVITSADQLNVSAYVPGIFQEGGKCTAIFKQGSTTLSKDSDGFGNVSYTQCAPIDASTLNFPAKGAWTVTVSYSSATAEGISNSQAIEVK